LIYIRTDPFLILPQLLCRILAVFSITEVNGYFQEELEIYHNAGIIIKKISFLIEKFAYLLTNKIITVTPELRLLLITKFKIDENKISYILNGVNLEDFYSINRDAALKQAGLDNRFFYLGFIGNFAPWQGLEQIIASMPELMKLRSNIRLLLIGDGILKTKITELIKLLKLGDNVIHLSSIAHNKINLYINCFDLALLLKSDLKSGLSPLKLYEYLACGKPVVASKLSAGSFDFIKRLNAGICVNISDSRDIINGIINIYDNIKSYSDAALASREYLKINHNWEIIAKRIIELSESKI